ncbi:MAG: ADP-ribosylglycohydrolase family protein [Eubacterium sp.]|nr:ADP-ribosylglycohydrolase family protein [Eubacterium sp.]
MKDRFTGCIIGGAAGDALGYPVEFLDDGGIVRRYGKKGIRKFDLENGAAQFSDDTQMTLFTMDGIRQGIINAETEGSGFEPEVWIYRAYLDWLQTQNGNWQTYKNSFTDLYRSESGLDARRAPGNTCLSALRAQQGIDIFRPQFGTGNPANHSKGCGGVMRVAPIGLMVDETNALGSCGTAAEIAAEAAAITHGHPLGWLPAAFLGGLINRIVWKNDGRTDLAGFIEKTREDINRQFAKTEYLEDMDAINKKALEMAYAVNKTVGENNPGPLYTDWDNIEELGGGWVGEEALAIALYCAVRFPQNFPEALRASVNHSGDSDSTGAVCGNILGAYLGFDEIVRQMKSDTEDNLVLESLEMYERLIYWTEAAYCAVMTITKGQ